MGPYKLGRISSTIILNYAEASTPIAISSGSASLLKCSSANRLQYERFYCAYAWRALTHVNRRLVKGEAGRQELAKTVDA